MKTNIEGKSDQSPLKKHSDNCPFIGLKGEPGSFFGYASPSNCCFRVTQPGSVNLAHQEHFCLTSSYQECEVFKAPIMDALPQSIKRDTDGRKSWLENYWMRYGIAAILALAIILLFLYLIFQRPLYGRDSTSDLDTAQQSVPTDNIQELSALPSATVTSTKEEEDFILGLLKEGTPSPSMIPSITPTPTSSPTVTPTFTPEWTPGPGFETPFGPDAAYLIHVVAEGENYPKIAQNYDTSVEVLQATNLLPEGVGLRAGLIIVILPGTQNPAGVPRFVTVLVDKPMTVEELAQVYQSNADEIQKYNLIDPSKPIPVGRWMIIPYP